MKTSCVRFLTACLTICLALAGGALHAIDLGSGRLDIAGTRLTISPESQTVPFNTATIVETALLGYDTASGVLPSDLKVVADFTGPEIDGILRLETIPNEPFRIPRLSVKGQYQLDNIRLVQGDELLAYGEPRSAAVLVTQVLVTRVTSRALTLDEIRSYGVVLDGDRLHAFNFTFGFSIDGEVFDYNLPVLFTAGGSGGSSVRVLQPPELLGSGGGTSSPRFRPPRLAPFTLELEAPTRDDPNGGCKAISGCYQADPISLPGVILFPADVSLLNQIFSVVVVAKNAAPAGDALVIRDLTARVSLPPGLRLAETEPPTPLGVPVPVRVPGPDGELGTADDVTFLIAQAEGQAEILVEGRDQGTHVVEFTLDGVLDGFPDGEIRRVTGTAKGAVVVRDPTLGVTITHPEVVRVDEEYSLLVTLSNTGNAPVNLLSISLPVAGLSGTTVVGSSTQTIDSLLPGESEIVDFRLLSQRTGKVVGTAIRHGSQIDPRFELSVGVGELGIPLSPEAIILPDSTEVLPSDLVRHSLALVGLGYSLGTAPVESIGPGLPVMDLGSLHEKVYWLGAAGRHVKLGEELFDAAAALAAQWTGARSPDWGWDELRRETNKGGLVSDSLAQVFAAEASATSPTAAFERFVATTASLGPVEAALVVGSNATLEISSRTSGKEVSGAGIDPTRLRRLPFAELFDLAGSQMGLLGWPESAGYRVRIEDSDGGPAALHLMVPDASGALRVIRWTGLSFSAGGSAEVEYQASDSLFTLHIDANGDGVAETSTVGVEATIAPRPFSAVAAVQDATNVSGHAVEILFTQDVDLQQLLPADPARFTIPGKVSNGGMVQAEIDFCDGGALGGCNTDPTAEENTGSSYLPGPRVVSNPFSGLINTRVVRVLFDNPISPYKTQDLTVRDAVSLTGETVTNVVLPVQTTVTNPGGIVQGTVFGPDGQPVPFARVELLQLDESDFGCLAHTTAAVETDQAGQFELDYVRQTSCSDLYTLRATEPGSGFHGTARGRIRFIGQVAQLDVLMLGRGTVRGRVTYDDGTVPEGFQVTGYSPVFFEGTEATYGPDGTYEIRDLPVGTISLGATDKQGGYVFQTVEIARAGAVVARDLTIIRRAPDEAIGDVRGTVYAPDGTTPVYDAYVALYVDGELTGVERSAFDGTFDFGTVRAGHAEIEAFDGATGLSGAQIYFDIQPDQVNDVTVLLRDDRGTVEGHVYRQTLDTVVPVEGAVVWVSGTPFNTVTDANGFYRMEGVFAGQRQVLAADLEAQTQVSDTVTISAAGQTVYRDLYFIESVGSGLTGEVLGFSGNPVPGATIHLDDGHGGWWKEVFTDASGRFSIPNLTPGGYKLHVFSGSAGTTAQATIRFEGETPFVHVRFKKGTIRGTTQVINELGQVVGVTSLVTYRTTVPLSTGVVGLDYVAHTLETNADGTFEIPDVLAGPYRLTVTNAFYGEKTFYDQIAFHGEVRQHDVLFEPNGEVRGVVLDWDRQTPAAGATVHLRHSSFSQYDVVTDAEGRFTFSLIPSGAQRFAIDAEIESNGVFRTAQVWVAITKPGQELDVEIVLPEQGSVNGWVEDANGVVVPGAVVTLQESVFPHRRLIHNTDGSGYFSFNNIFAGSVALSAQAPQLGGLGGRDTVDLVEEGQEVFSLVVLEGTGEIAGQVISPETGQVVPTAQVALDRGLRNSFDSITTSEGEFRFRLLPLDTYRIRVFDPTTGRFGESAWVTIDSNGQVIDVPVTLEARGSVDGHLYEPETLLGVPGATIRLRTQSLRPFTTYASTDVDGYFEFQGIPEGSFSLSTREPEGRRLASGSGAILQEDELVTVDLYLEQVGRVVGSVLNPAGQTAGLFPNANAVLYELDNTWQVIGATLDNPFAFDGVIADRKLEVRVFENGGDHRGKLSGVLAEGQAEITLDVEMEPLGSAAVTVTDSLGNPVAGVDVQLRNNGFYGYKNLYATSGPDGRAVFDGIGEGWISVTATQPVTLLRGSAAGSLTLDGEQVELVAQLEDSGTVKGRIVLSDGVTPAVDALVVVTSGSRTLQSLADANGDFEFSSIPLGSYTLYVQESFGPGSLERFGSIGANAEIDDFGTLVLDGEQPQVVSIDPVSGSSDLPLSSVVTVRFSEPIDTSRWSPSWISFRTLTGNGVGSTPSWSEGDTVLTLTPNGALTSFTGYDVIVQDVIDLAGKHLAEPVRTTFNTVDVVPPTVVDMVPRDGQNQIPVDASILVTFSEKVAFASLSGSAFQLTDLTGGGGVTTTFQHLNGERQVLLTPVSGLQTDRQYQLSVQGVQDNGGNTMTAPVTTTFWSVDTIPPQILSVDFPAGTSFVSGGNVPVTVTATDERGVASTTVAITEWSWTDTTDPYEVTGLAPVVTATTDVAVDVTVTDIFGNSSSSAATIQVSPRVNASPPILTLACVRDLGFVVPGVASEIRATSSDDEAIESLRLFVDGQEVERVTPVNLPEVDHIFLWAPPASSTTGTTYLLRVESRDFAGNVTAQSVTLQVPQGTILRGGVSLFDDYAGQELTLAEGVFLAREPLHLATLRIARGATLVTTGQTEAERVLEIVADEIDVACGAAIDQSGLGYPGGVAPAWVTVSTGDAGGSHGGFGRSGVPGEVYDSVYRPSVTGSGGAGTGGGAGGGVVSLTVGTLVVDGNVLARGVGNADGAFEKSSGAGGTIMIQAGLLKGAGTIDASGGNQMRCYVATDGYGSGGGGRVALDLGSLGGFDPATQARAQGGSQFQCDTEAGYGGAGTVLVKLAGDAYGRLRIDNGTDADGADREGPSTELPTLGTGTVVGLTPVGSDAWVEGPQAFLPRWVGASMVLLDAVGQELGQFAVLEVDGSGRARLEGAGLVSGAVSYRGEYRFDQLTLVDGTKLAAADPILASDIRIEGQVEAPGELEAGTLLVTAGSHLSPISGDSLRLTVTGTMTVEPGALVDVTGLGYPAATAPSGITPSAGDTGGSHGGRGGGGGAGEVYDSVYLPTLAGAGGGSASAGTGGGAVFVEAGELVLDGSILAIGVDGGNSAGGGGTVTITVGTLRGAGVIDASGGAHGGCAFIPWPGAGGGGRIAIDAQALNEFDPGAQARSWGGSQIDCSTTKGYAAAGTVFVKVPADVYGRLRIDNGTETDGTERVGLPTELPALGAGTVLSVSDAGGDAWVQAAQPLSPRWAGAWMILEDGGGTELGGFRVAAIDQSGRALLEGAAGQSTAAAFHGEYRFDEIHIGSGASLRTTDSVTSPDLVLAGTSEIDEDVVAENLVIRQGAVLRPSPGKTLRFLVSNQMTIEAGAVLDVSGEGYAAEGAPSWVSAAVGEDAAGSHGSAGTYSGVAGEDRVYDSVYAPRLGGGGGSQTTSGSPGGGVVEIEAGTLMLDGQIVANGLTNAGNDGPPGAGGAVLVRATSMLGTGSIEASGGEGVDDCYWFETGAGGGGRVALEVGSLVGFAPATQISVYGGTVRNCIGEPVQHLPIGYAPAGTVWVKQGGLGYGDLIIDNGTEADGTPRTEGGMTHLPALGEGAVTAVEVAGVDAWITASTPFRPRWEGAWMALLDGAGADLGRFEVVEIDPAGRALLAGGASVAAPTSYRGEYTFDSIALRNGSGLSAADPVVTGDHVFNEDAAIEGTLIADSIVVDPGVTVHGTGELLRWIVANGLTIEAGGRLEANDQGYTYGQSPDGVLGSVGIAGGSHGGTGSLGTMSEPAGEVYDSVYHPTLPGGGGAEGWRSAGLAGGGGIEIVAGQVVLDGEIQALSNDSVGDADHAGAGGTVSIESASLSGIGSIDVSGGRGSIGVLSTVGAGGGGRVALHVESLIGFDPATQVRASGGGHRNSGTDSFASPGTVFYKELSDSHGHLIVDAAVPTSVATPSLPRTVLPTIGAGTVGLTVVDAVDATDLWIEPQDPVKLFDLGVVGMWARIAGTDYPVIGQSADRRQVLLDGAAGAVSVGDAFLGVYKFDSVTVTGDAHLEIRDADEVGALTVDPGSTLTRLDLDPPVITVTGPAAGTLFTEGDPLTITADVTDPSGIVSVTFRMEGQSFLDDTAPYEWVTTAPVLGTEQDVVIQIDAVDGNGNSSSTYHTIHVQPPAPADPPVVGITCPSPGARLAPGTGLDFSATATHDDGIDRMELQVGADPTPVATDSVAPYTFHYDVPIDALEGDVIALHFWARSTGGVWGEAVYTVDVIAANVISANTNLAAADASLDGTSVVVSGGTFTVQGSHTLRDLVVLDGAVVTHPASTTTTVERLDLSLTRDLFVACGGSIDVTGKGYPAGTGYQPAGIEPFLVADAFSDGNYAGWQIVDEGEQQSPSNWSASSTTLRQYSNIYSLVEPGKGTYALWPGPLSSGDYRFGFFMLSGDDDRIGVMFRYTDADNYYRFVWDRQGASRRLEKVAAGVVTVLAEDATIYTQYQWYLVQIVANGSSLELWIDGTLIFTVQDSTHPTGSVAFYSCENTDSRFAFGQVTLLSSPSVFSGGAHGGRGGAADGSSLVFGSLLDPNDAGAGGQPIDSSAGGGVVRIAAAGQAIVDGTIATLGSAAPALRTGSAGGSIRLDAASITGVGTLDASGGSGLSARAAGGGGRIALYGATIDEGLISRTLAAGGDGDTPDEGGAAGTIYVKRDSQALGDLILDNGGLDTAQPTELLAVGTGVVDVVGVSSMTDNEADFQHDLTGLEIFFNGNQAALWPIVSHAHHGQTLELDTGAQALTASVGDSYEGLYRFDRVIVRGGAEVVTRSPVLSPAPEVEAGSSWTSEAQPSVVVTAPLDGATVVAGSPVAVSATAQSAFGVERARFDLFGMSTVDSAAPFEANGVAPPVTVATQYPVTVTSADRSGHEVTDEITIVVQPSADAVAPALLPASCPRSGDYVAAGSIVPLQFTATDDALIYRWTVLIDGTVLSEERGVGQASTSAVVPWKVPVGTPAGTTFSVRIETEDYGGNVTAVTKTLSTPTGTVRIGDQTLDSSLNGQALILGPGNFTVVEPLALASLTLMDGAVVKPAALGQAVTLGATGTAWVQCGGRIDVSAQGYEGGNNLHEPGLAPSWVSASGRGEGGSHGGVGQGGYYAPTQDPGDVFDSVYSPSLGGGGGGRYSTPASQWGGSGGGVVEIVAGGVVLDGEVRSRGGDAAYYAGAGAGGAIVIDTPSLSGVGSVDVSGGDYRKADVGGTGAPGGGGRVALYVDDLSSFDVASQVRAWGGSRYDNASAVELTAAPGTIYGFELTSTYGWLRVDGGQPQAVPATELPALGSGTVTTLEVSGSDAWLTGDVSFRTRHVGSWLVLRDATQVELGSYRVLEVDGVGRALLSGASAVTGAASYQGEYRFDRIESAGGGGIRAVDVVSGSSTVFEGQSLAAAKVVADTVTITSGAFVRPTNGASIRFVVSNGMTVEAGGLLQAGTVTLEVAGTLTVAGGATIDSTGLGYEGGNNLHEPGLAPAGVTASGRGEAGSHGGIGREGLWTSTRDPGEIFDSVYAPSLGGGGGGRNSTSASQWGGTGGGVVEIVAGNVVLDGEVRSRGGNAGYYGGSGAGGTVVIDAASLGGSGSIDASGGDYRKADVGGAGPPGGGGRVALNVADLSLFDPTTQIKVWGGSRYSTVNAIEITGSSGTLFVSKSTSTYGDLFVHLPGTLEVGIPNTQLPTIGTGTVGLTEVDATDATDLWIEPQDAGTTFSMGTPGMWVRINASDYPVIDQSVDRRRLLLDGAAGLVSVGDAYQGIYKFDSVIVRGGAVLEFLDTAEVVTYDVDADSQVITPQ